jgi:hypothetical protein
MVPAAGAPPPPPRPPQHRGGGGARGSCTMAGTLPPAGALTPGPSPANCAGEGRTRPTHQTVIPSYSVLRAPCVMKRDCHSEARPPNGLRLAPQVAGPKNLLSATTRADAAARARFADAQLPDRARPGAAPPATRTRTVDSSVAHQSRGNREYPAALPRNDSPRVRRRISMQGGAARHLPTAGSPAPTGESTRRAWWPAVRRDPADTSPRRRTLPFQRRIIPISGVAGAVDRSDPRVYGSTTGYEHPRVDFSVGARGWSEGRFYAAPPSK